MVESLPVNKSDSPILEKLHIILKPIYVELMILRSSWVKASPSLGTNGVIYVTPGQTRTERTKTVDALIIDTIKSKVGDIRERKEEIREILNNLASNMAFAVAASTCSSTTVRKSSFTESRALQKFLKLKMKSA